MQEPPKGPWGEVSDADLDRVWRAQATLSPAERLKVRDELFRRDLWFPLADVRRPYVPGLPNLDEVFRRAGLASWLMSLDAHERTPGVVRPFNGGALVESGPGRFVAFLFPVWRGEPGPLPAGELDAAFVMGEGTVATVPSEVRRLDPTRLEEPLAIGSLTIEQMDGWLEVSDDEGTRVVLGMEMPAISVLGDPIASDAVGSFSTLTEEDIHAFEAAKWDARAAIDLEELTLLTNAKGTGTAARALAEMLGVPCWTVGAGVAVEAAAQSIVTACLQSDPDERIAALEGASAKNVESALSWLFIEGKLDAMGRLLEVATDGPATGRYRGAMLAARGDLEAARTAWTEAAEAAEPDALSMGQLAWLAAQDGDLDGALAGTAEASRLADGDSALDANLALLQWRMGKRELAIQTLQETQLSSVTWLGSVVEATIHDGDPERLGDQLLDPIGYRHAPVGTASCYLRAGSFAEAERLLRRGLALCPGQPAASGHLVLHLCRLGRFDEALVLANEVLERRPHFTVLRALRASIHRQRKRWGAAAEDLRRCLQAVPDHVEWRLNLICALIADGQPDEAQNEAAELAGDQQLKEAVKKRLATSVTH